MGTIVVIVVVFIPHRYRYGYTFTFSFSRIPEANLASTYLLTRDEVGLVYNTLFLCTNNLVR